MSRRVALIGAGGQLATDLRAAWAASHPEDVLVPLTHADVEVTDADSVRAALDAARADVVLNTSAYHRVDELETNVDRALAVNAAAPRLLAVECAERDAHLVHFSTDYVFGGERDRPWLESDRPCPVNVYGASKAAGEMLVLAVPGRSTVIRSSGLYGLAGSSGKGGNFVETMLRLAGSGRPIRVVDDQRLTPTSTAALARQVVAIVDAGATGLLHATCQGDCTWFEFAAEIFRLAGVNPEVGPQSTAESGAAARRPTYSVLENRRLAELGLDVLPDWREALAEYLQARAAAA